jgi:hypothetical protein
MKETIPDSIRIRLCKIAKTSDETEAWKGIKDEVFYNGARVFFDEEGNPIGCQAGEVIVGTRTKIAKDFSGRDSGPQGNLLLRNGFLGSFECLEDARKIFPGKKPHVTVRGKHSQATRAILKSASLVWTAETKRRKQRNAKSL